jgi:hypothetical protein
VYYAIHAFAKPPPKTMSKEWQEATNEYAKVRDYFFLLYFKRDPGCSRSPG